MESWEAAARKFIEHCPFVSDIEIVYLTGSYANGTADEFSDIDLYIILNDAVDWRERGNKNVDGFVVEYFANPLRQVKRQIDIQHNDGNLIAANMILRGIILLDKSMASRELRDYCLQRCTEPFPEMSENAKKVGLYGIWDRFNELERAFQNKTVDFDIQYSAFGIETIYTYSRYISSSLPPYYHLYTWLIDRDYFNRFGVSEFKDDKFRAMMLVFFQASRIDERFKCAAEMKQYVMSQMNRFDINNYVLRTPCEC